MASVHDIASYILKRNEGSMTAMKLQKLAYYSHAWHLVWEERPLFKAPIEAWANGPVVPALYKEHKGKFSLSSWPLGDSGKLTDDERSTVDIVLDTYGQRDAVWLSELTHSEAPWRDARKGLAPGERGSTRISDAAMAEYYEALVDDGYKV